MAGLDTASRKAITMMLQDWREAYDEYADCQQQIASLSMRVDALLQKSSDAASREEEAKEKFNAAANAHADDPEAVDQINALVAQHVSGIMGVQVVSGMEGVAR